MAKTHFGTSILLAGAIALAIGPSHVHARDASLCTTPPAEAIAKAEPCLAATGQPDAASGAQSVLQHDTAATTPVTVGPITHSRHFIYRLLRPETPSGETIVLLHGSGGDEASLFKLAQRAAPEATLLGVRGRIVQKGMKRWYARLTPTEFDQADIRKEAQAFVAFLKERMVAEKLDLERTVFIGYSNGANLIAAVSLLHPDLIQRAVLLRAMPVLDKAPATNLKGTHFLTVAGKLDQVYAPFSPALEALLRDRGALVDAGLVAGNHYLGDEDVKLVSDWLGAAKAMAGGTP